MAAVVTASASGILALLASLAGDAVFAQSFFESDESQLVDGLEFTGDGTTINLETLTGNSLVDEALRETAGAALHAFQTEGDEQAVIDILPWFTGDKESLLDLEPILDKLAGVNKFEYEALRSALVERSMDDDIQ